MLTRELRSSPMRLDTSLAILERTCARVSLVCAEAVSKLIVRADYTIMNKNLLQHTHVYSSSESVPRPLVCPSY
jgi:hypothetical protein